MAVFGEYLFNCSVALGDIAVYLVIFAVAYTQIGYLECQKDCKY
ncbi:MAG: hypothetical protein ACLU3P_04910 [[Eubacterium] siraeum]